MKTTILLFLTLILSLVPIQGKKYKHLNECIEGNLLYAFYHVVELDEESKFSKDYYEMRIISIRTDQIIGVEKVSKTKALNFCKTK